MKKKITSRRLSKVRMKMCNLCGEDVLVYSIVDNAPLCEDCVPTKDIKKIPNGSEMLQLILDK